MKTKLVDGFLNLQLGHRFWGQTASIPSRHHEKNDLGPICPFGDVTRAENEACRWFSEFAARTQFLGSNNKYSISAQRKNRFGANMSIWWGQNAQVRTRHGRWSMSSSGSLVFGKLYFLITAYQKKRQRKSRRYSYICSYICIFNHRLPKKKAEKK